MKPQFLVFFSSVWCILYNCFLYSFWTLNINDKLLFLHVYIYLFFFSVFTSKLRIFKMLKHFQSKFQEYVFNISSKYILYGYIFSYRGGNRHKAWSPAYIMCLCLCVFVSLCACICINRQIPWFKSTHLLTQQYINSRKILTSQYRLLWKEGEAINYSTQPLTCGNDRCRITDGIQSLKQSSGRKKNWLLERQFILKVLNLCCWHSTLPC